MYRLNFPSRTPRACSLMHILLMILLSSVGAPSQAEESTGWKQSFVPGALETYLGSASPKLIVIPAGADSLALREAAQALEGGLRATNKAGLVMNSDSLGSMTGLDDQGIVKRCASVPVDRIAVLRVFPDATGRLSTAVVSVYDKAGHNVEAFTADEGKPVAAKSGGANASQGLSSQAADSVSKALEKTAQAGSKAQEEYDLHYIGFDDVTVVPVYGYGAYGATPKQWVIPYEGKYKKPLEGVTFYEKLERQDLVKAYDDKRSTKTLLIAGGGAAIVGGLVVSVVGVVGNTHPCGLSIECHDVSEGTVVAGLALSLAGTGFLLWGFSMNPNPIDASQARQLAEEYNQKLKTKLGLASDSDPAPLRRPEMQIAVAPFVTRTGGGLSLGLTF